MDSIKSFFRIFVLWTLVGVANKVVFLLLYHSLLGEAAWGEQCAVVWHGLRLDMAIAGYITIVPGLLLIAAVWVQSRWLRSLWNGYFALVAMVAAVGYVVNLALYKYWRFPLDTTPLLYVRTSPADAMASLTWWQTAAMAAVMGATAFLLWRLPHRLPTSGEATTKQKGIWSFLLLLLTAALLLPIRGGVSTGTNHTGSVYFSGNMTLNHAAVNPIFSFVESAVHQEEIGSRYRFMDDGQATELFSTMTCNTLRADSTRHAQRPNVVLIVLESFSDTLMHVDGVTPHLLSLTREGIWFRRFYASSHRTDRALVSIHSALPAQPTMSVMDMPRKSTSLPSIAGSLARQGYSTTFYYGGDTNYSNMQSYFIGTGFQHVISEKDFPGSQRTGKWGVADGPVFDRLLEDIRNADADRPFFMSFMTGSSHEPFDVPDYRKIADNPVFNAFSYADHCLGLFIDRLRQLPCWHNTLVLITADHMGAFPDSPDNYSLWRYHIPFIMTGGAVSESREVDTIGSQTDIAATLMGMIGIDHSEFTYSKDLFDKDAPHFAFFTFPDAMGLADDSGWVVYDNTLGRTYNATGDDPTALTEKAKAYLQKLYDDIDRR